MEINGNIVTFEMSLKKDQLKGIEYKINVTVDVADVSRETMLENCFSGASMRVRLQTKLRKRSNRELAQLAISGYKTTWSSISAREGSTPANPADLLMKLSRSEFVDFMDDQYGIEEHVAIKMYNKKHGIEG